MDAKTIYNIQRAWHGGYTVRQITDEFSLSDAETFAILQCSKGLTNEQVAERLTLINDEMTGSKIKAIMQGNI